MKPLLVGEAPSRTSDPALPFDGRSGRRLAELVGRQLEDVFDLRNLLDEWPGAGEKGSLWDFDVARERAVEITREWEPGRILLLAGRRVARAFAVSRYPYLQFVGVRFPLAIVPHPSGVDRWWNDPANVEDARRFLRNVAFLTARGGRVQLGQRY